MPDIKVGWIIALIVLFLLGSIFGLRVSPREKALGQLREKARKLGLQPRLVPAPAWTGISEAAPGRAAMVAYYCLIVPQAQFALMRAINRQQHWQVIEGRSPIDGQTIDLPGVYALDLQANNIGLYWDESQDFDGQQLEKIYQYLYSLAKDQSHTA